jgi:O-antigen/teichoic acid export membrane protein
MVGRMLYFLLVPWYTRLFIPAEYGVVTDWYALVAFLNVVYVLGMETAFFRFAREGDSEIDQKGASRHDSSEAYRSAYATVALNSILLSSLFLLLAKPLSAAMHYSNHPEYVRWFALILLFDALVAIPFARLRQREQALKYTLLRLLSIALNIGFNLFFLAFCPFLIKNGAPIPSWIYQPDIGVGYIFISNLLSSGILALLMLGEIPRQLGRYSRSLAQKMFSYAWPLMAAGLAGMANETLDRMMLKYLLPLSPAEALHQLGIYGAVYKLAMFMSLFTQTFRMAAEPFFFKLGGQTGDHKMERDNALDIVMQGYVVIGSAVFLTLTLFLHEIKWFLSPAYFEGLWVVPLLLMANLLLGIYYNQSVWYKLADQTRWGLYLMLFGAGITLLCNFMLVPLYGYGGSALATLLCYFGMVVANSLASRNRHPITYSWKKLVGWLVAAAVFSALYHILLPHLSNPGHQLLRVLIWAMFMVQVGRTVRSLSRSPV